MEVDEASQGEAAYRIGADESTGSTASRASSSPSSEPCALPSDACAASAPGRGCGDAEGRVSVQAGEAASRRAGKMPTRWSSPEPSTGETGSSSNEWLPGMPKRLLHLFSGPGGRIDGLRQIMRDIYRLEVVEVDTLIDLVHCDLLRREVFDDLMRRIRAGEFFGAVIGVPCSTFSVARIPRPGQETGPPQVRSWWEPDGMEDISMLWHMRVAASNILVERSVAIARELRAVGASFIIENPPTRSDKASDLYRECWSSHASLWMHSAVKPLCEERWTREVTLP